MKVMITGIAGSGGSYLADWILENVKDAKVYGLTRWHSTTKSNIDDSRVTMIECDMTDYGSLYRTLEEVQPHIIFNMASYANVRAAFDTPLSVLNNNVTLAANLFDAVRRLKESCWTCTEKYNPTIVHCSTSEVYGQVDPKNVPIKEDCPIRPVNPYAVSKTAQDMLADSYFQAYGIRIIRTRMFTYLNPRRSDLFATSFASQIVKIENGLKQRLHHGNLDSVRTLIDVRDASEAYWTASQKCEPGEVYNIGGTVSVTVGEFLSLLIERAKKYIETYEDPSLLRPVDVTLQIPDITKFQRTTGWSPRYTFEESVDFLLTELRDAYGG